MVKFNDAKKLFKDVVDINSYIPLPSSEKAKYDLINAINEKEKMILLTGEAGSGKSFLLKSIYNEINNDHIFFVSNPYLEIEAILKLIKQLDINSHYVLLLDEAQLLAPQIWENLRIYSDKGNITIVFSTHDTNINRLLSKKHFKTRINYIIRMKPVSKKETEYFILTKLLKNNFNEIAAMFKKNNFDLIYKYTKGSLRATNQIMSKLMNVLNYFYKKNPDKFNLEKIDNKYIHIAIMDLKATDA